VSITDYYLRRKETNKSLSYTEYTTPCGTLDYIISSLINDTNGNHAVYVHTGTHNYTLLNNIRNVIFSLTAYDFSSSFSSSDMDTYPVILTNTSAGQLSPFYLSDNISSSFLYLKFLIGNGSLHIARSVFQTIYIYIYCR
jgi:hypothetical protein